MSLQDIDWSAPWLAPYRAVGQAVAAQAHQGIAAALNAAASAPVQFVPQSALPPGEAYEHFIFHTRQCPSRDNLHDFFNGLCWQHFPQTKTRLNQLQAAQIAADGVQPLRGPVRDALTVFDENAAFLIAPPALWEALRAQDWRRLFVTLRPLWAQAQLLLFGHALLEKLVSPRKPITAHVYCAQAAINSVVNLDAIIAGQLSAAHLGSKPFLPLPVLGVPGWCADNAAPGFYADTQIFRPPRA
ncbi:DUF3025 domain-containing protein [Rhodoferax sp.]|uniref:DUF3025 domain-containing protein n=1 Tax=Rhodoferax sp. TaxID=50421 RepID=UPI0025FD7B05|nr:DUF3025 domain-containing protein [Rhodoferax sp.]